MNVSASKSPEPDAGEVVVWRHSASIESQSKYLQRGELSPWVIKYGKRLYWVALILIWGFIIYGDIQNGRPFIFFLESLQGGLMTALMVGGFLLLFFGPPMC